MAKIKFTKKEIARLNFILEKEIREAKANKVNIAAQDFEIEERKTIKLQTCDDEIEFLKIMKEKVELEIFGNG